MQEHKSYVCLICGWVYEEEHGHIEDNIAAGTLWADVPLDWLCPECGVSKLEFEMLEI
jgi:rubredoxin